MQRNSTAVTTVLNFISTKKLTITTNYISGTKGLWDKWSMVRMVYTGALKSRDLTSRDLTTRHHVPFANFALSVCYALMSRKTTELYVKVFQRVQQLVP